ncbi:hypothetical protein V3C99_009763 [Haemonchus contortus]
MAKALPLLLFLILILDLSEIVRCLSAEGKESLAKGIPGGDLEKRRERLNHLKELFAKRYNLTSVGKPEDKEKPTSDGALAGEEVVANENTDLSVEEINQKEGVADYLFDGDIDLTEEQLEMIEASLSDNNHTRRKRQMDTLLPRWENNRLFYSFGPAITTRYRTIVRQALAYISGRTCLTFTESDTAPNRVNVISGSGCYSKIGMVGGVQELSLGNGCDQMGIVSHEFMHALGSWHMQMRSDRDDHLIVDLTYVKAGYEGNFGKIEADRTNNYNPFDYGSVMQYAANLFTTQGYSMIPRIGKYLMTPGTRIVSFYDIKMLNDHYGCHAQCGAATCANGGEPRPKNCDVCNCPEGYGGAKCAARPAGCGETLVATAAWKTKTFTFGNAVVKKERDTYMRCNHWVKAPAGKKVQVRVTAVKNVQCRVGCRQNSIEIKYRPDKGITNPRICCGNLLNQIVTSELNPTPIISYNRYLTSTYTFQYRYI